MNDNDNANMYDIFERLNRVQAMPSKIDEAAARAAEKTRLDEKYMGFEKTVKAVAKNPKVKDPEAVAAAIGRKKYGKEKFQKAAAAGKKLGEGKATPEEKAKYDAALAQKIFKLIKKDYANQGFSWNSELNDVYGFEEFLGDAFGQRWDETQPATVTDYFTALPGTRKRGIMKAVKQAVQKHFTAGSDYDDYRYGGPTGGRTFEDQDTLMTPKQKSFAKLAPPADKITFADKIAGAKKEVDEMLGDVAADAIKKAISTHKGGQVSKGKGITKHAAGAGVYGGSDPDQGHIVDRMKGPSDTALRGKRKQETEEGNAFSGAVAKAKATGADEFKVGSKEYKVKENFPTVADAEKRLRDKEGKTTKGTVTKTATGLRHTRDYEHDVSADDEKSSSGEKRKAGRPKKYTDDAPRQERVTAKSRKTDRTAHGQAGFKKDKVKENDVNIVDQGEYDQEGDMAKNDIKTIVRHAQALHKILGDNDNLPEWVQSKLAKIEAMMISVDEYMQNQDAKDGEEQELDEKAVSKKQQRFMGMVHAAQKGEKPASKEVAKVAKTMKKKDAEDFASTKHKGLPEKAKKKKEEESVEETTTAGSVATAPSSGKSSGGMSFGKGIYDSVDRKVEAIIAESMSINMSTSTEGGQTITVTASDDDAMKLAALLKMAGIGSGDTDGGCDSCGESPCDCDHVDENAPDWPTNKEYNGDALQYAGGLNRPKSSGQTTAPVFSRDPRRQHTPEDTELTRIKEIAGIKEAAKPDFLDMDKDGDKEEPMKKAVKDKEEEKKVEESIFALTNQWRAFKG